MPLTLTRLFTANLTDPCDPLESKEGPSMASLESIDSHFQYQTLQCNKQDSLLSGSEGSETSKTEIAKNIFLLNS